MPSKFAEYLDYFIILVLHVLVIFTPLFFFVKNEELFEFNKMIFVYGATVLIFTAMLIRLLIRGWSDFRKTAFDLPILLLVISQIISTIFSIHPRTSIYGYYTRFHGGLLSTFSYAILYYAFTLTIKKRHLPGFFIALLIGATGAALYAFPEHFGFSPSCLLLDNQFTASCWIQDVQHRVFGTFGQPNWLAAYLITIIPLLFIPLVKLKTANQKLGQALLSGGLFFLFFSVLIFTKSRSGLLGLAVGFAVFGVLFGLRFLRTKHLPGNFSSWLVMVAIGLTTIGMFGTIFTPSVGELLQPEPETNQSLTEPASVPLVEIGGTDSGEIRKIVWEGAYDVWQRYPLFGSGVETFAYSYYLDRPLEHNLVSEWDFLYNKAHNEILNIMATTGLVGLLAFLFWQAKILWVGGKIAITSDDEVQFVRASAILAGIAGLNVSNFFGFSTVMVGVLMWLLPAMLVVSSDDYIGWPNWLTRFLHKIRSLSLVKTDKWSGPLILGIVGALMIGLILIVNVAQIWLGDYHFALAKKAFNSNDYATALNEAKIAINFSPSEALYYELYSKVAAQYALAAHQQQEPELAEQFTTASIEASNASLLLNPAHLNFYKSRNQVLVTLAQIDPQYYGYALQTLEVAQTLSPTDPKLVYYQGVIEQAINKQDEAIASLETAVEMKPNYDAARALLGELYEISGNYDAAADQYRYILENINPANELVRERLEFVATQSAKVEN